MAQFTTKQAAQYLGISSVRIWQLIKGGKIEAVKIGRDWIITQAELDRFKALVRVPHRPARRVQGL